MAPLEATTLFWLAEKSVIVRPCTPAAHSRSSRHSSYRAGGGLVADTAWPRAMGNHARHKAQSIDSWAAPAYNFHCLQARRCLS